MVYSRTVDLTQCVRCGSNHKALEFRMFKNPVREGDNKE